MSVEINVTDQIVEIEVAAGASVQPTWGAITGTLSNQTDLQNALDAKVPYSGATGNINLGEYELKAGQLTLDTSPTGTATVATMRWNDTTGLTETTLKGGNVVLKNGVDLVARVVNKVTPNTTLTKAAYQAVRVSGAQGQRLAIELAQANNDNNSADTIGLVTETIATNQEGFIMTVGQLEGINTTGSLQGETWVDGDVLYLSPTTAGALTNVKPVAPQHLVIIGYVEYAHANNGKIYVKVMNGWELGELHDVNTTGATNGSVLKYNGSIWVPSSDIDTGITSLNALTALSQTFATGTSGTDFNISSATSTHTFNLPSASATNRGLLTSADWTTFNNKQNALTNPITGTGTSGQVAYFTGATTQTGSNNLFWDNANSRLGIGTNNPVNRFQVDGLTVGLLSVQASSDRIGIGTTSPNSRLEVYSATGYNVIRSVGGSGAYFETYSTAGTRHSSFGSESNGDVYIGARANNPILFLTNNTVQMRLFANGNLGVGVSSDAGFRIDVNGTSRLNGITSIIGSTTSAYISTIRQTNTTADVSFGLLVTAGTSANDVAFRVQNAAQSTNYFTVLGNGTSNFSGNLLVGSTTDSGQRLQVTGDTLLRGSGNTSATTALRVQNSDTLQLFQILNNGNVGIGDASSAGYTLNVGKAITGSIISAGIWQNGSVLADVTTNAIGIYNFLRIPASTAISSYQHFRAESSAFGAGGTLGTQIGFIAENSLTGATNNYGFYGNIASGTGRWNLYMNGTADNYLAGSLGIGINSLTGYNLRVNKNITGSTFGFNVSVGGAIQSDVTNNGTYIHAISSTQATTFTLPQIRIFSAEQGTFGAGSTVTDQIGFFAQSSLIGATNNFGFYGNIASGTGRWNLYMGGTANNYLAGSLGIGATSLSGISLGIAKSITGATVSRAVHLFGTVQSDVTIFATGFSSKMNVTSGFTLPSLVHFYSDQGTISGTLTNQYGFAAESTLIGATNNYGFFGSIPAGTGRWNLYMNGTAANYLAGSLGIGTTTPQVELAVYSAVTSRIHVQNATSGINANDGLQFAISGSDGYLWNWENGTLQFATNGTERARIFAGGNVGIGTTTDAGFKLDVNGTMRVSGASTFSTSVNVSSGSAPTGIFLNSGVSALTRLQRGTAVTILTDNYAPFSPQTQDDVTIPSWDIRFGGGSGADFFRIARSAAGSTTLTSLLTIAGTGAATFSSSVTAASYTINDAGNITIGTTTGTKIGTATSQKIGFWNATPIVQPTTAVAAAAFVANTGTAVNDASTFDGYTMAQIVKALRNAGLLA